jgi:lipid II:glycine glycyltransferase (peptidoglycan interpeptide bridge formation enzyme)
MIKILTQDEIDAVQWQQLVDNSATASFFQTKECYEFYLSLSFLKPFVFGVSENNNLTAIICGYIIADGNKLKQFFSRRAIVPGGLLLSENASSAAIEILLNKVVSELQRKAIYIEIRNYNDYSGFCASIEQTGFKYQSHLNFHVDTTNTEGVLQRLSESKRRQLKSAQKEGVMWYETKELDDVKAFYSCLQTLYKTKIQLPLFPFEFFEKLVKLPHAKLLVVKHKNKIIGGMACVFLDGKTLYEWFVCGDEHAAKELFPSVVATYAGIEFAVKHNIPRFDFMGAGKPDKNYGVREFKSKFGGELVQHGRFLYICKPLLYIIGKSVIRFCYFF